MGYFVNDDEASGYRERWCVRCAYRIGASGQPCPVWAMHVRLNEVQRFDAGTGAMLASFIPRTPSGNGECALFVDMTKRRVAVVE